MEDTGLKQWFQNKNRVSEASRVKRQLVGAREEQGTLFGGRALLWVIALVTLFLQIISFLTTLNGAQVYLGGIFVLAPLFFALAVQMIVYFLSNSLRNRVTGMRIAALTAAVLCSVYFSYIGIYNTVNPPQQYLESRYGEIYKDLNTTYDGINARIMSEVKDSVNTLTNRVSSEYSALALKNAQLLACEEELAKVNAAVSSQLRAPNRNSYANYEDYVAAYNVYLSSVSQNSGTEDAANRQTVLKKYGFETQQEFAQERAQAVSRLATLDAAVAGMLNAAKLTQGTESAVNLEALRTALLQDLEQARAGGTMPQSTGMILPQLVNLYNGLGGTEITASEDVLARFRASLDGAGKTLLLDFDALENGLEGGMATQQNAMLLKSEMDSQIISAISAINSIAPAGQKLEVQQRAYRIDDLHVLPLKNLTLPATSGMAIFCLTLAALIDGLTVLFALITRTGSPLLGAAKAKANLRGDEELFAEQVFACLAIGAAGYCPQAAVERLIDFMRRFAVSNATGKEGYALCAKKSELSEYEALLALLCQTGFAKLVPLHYFKGLQQEQFFAHQTPRDEQPEEEDEMVLLGGSFQYWATQKISELTGREQEFPLESSFAAGRI